MFRKIATSQRSRFNEGPNDAYGERYAPRGGPQSNGRRGVWATHSGTKNRIPFQVHVCLFENRSRAAHFLFHFGLQSTYHRPGRAPATTVRPV